MMRGVRILPAVLSDVTTAVSWYDETGYKGLGDRFLQSFQSALIRIQEQSSVFRPSYRDFRKLLLPSFPYFVHFAPHGEEWIVSLVIHASRRPALAKSLLNRRTNEETRVSKK